MLKAFGRWSAKQGRNQPIIPPGNPPAQPTTDRGCDGSGGE